VMASIHHRHFHSRKTKRPPQPSRALSTAGYRYHNLPRGDDLTLQLKRRASS
jgi:hypothetical protein